MKVSDHKMPKGFIVKPHWAADAMNYPIVHVKRKHRAKPLRATGSAEGVTTRVVSPNNNPPHEPPAPRKGVKR